jgi:energy-coupling factor transporter ATP-binding protein EcfA2
MKYKEDIILIKLGVSYKENISTEKLKEVTSISWKIGEDRLKEGFRYYCPVYKNKIMEVYEFLGYEKDLHPDNEGRFILKGEIADEVIRSKLMGVDVSTVHKSSGNPIKYSTFEEILNENNKIGVFDYNTLVNHIHGYTLSKGYFFSLEQITNFYLSLKTKPFVILSGISGTGKTKIVQLFAESIGATSENGQFTLIPVRPDWSDGSDLIGYRDIKGEFRAGPLTKVLMEANQPENRDKPYFLLLDEMNLARVEYYFSDLLSVMESRDCQDGEMVSAPVVEEEEVGKLLLRDNFYIIGTVNMDETTHPFSPKVLDRANTIEYNDVVLDHFGFLTRDSFAEPVAIDNQQMAGRFLNLKDAFFDHEDLVREVTGLLVEVNKILEPIKAHFGYRVRDEVCFYMIYNNEGQLMEFDVAFDYQLVQKVLPRLTGNDLKTEEALKKLFLFCTSHEWDEMNAVSIVKEARFSKSAEKLSNMIPKIMHDGFTSFWGS